jgi:hypothetical protein
MLRLKDRSLEILVQLQELADQLRDSEFTRELPVLLNNSIGKHYRHIIEFFLLMLAGTESGVVDYDSRLHDTVLERDRLECIRKLNGIIRDLPVRLSDKAMGLKVSYPPETDGSLEIPSSTAREYVFNLEHAIHHMAIIRIALQHEFTDFGLSEAFGYAYSTLKHIKK